MSKKNPAAKPTDPIERAKQLAAAQCSEIEIISALKKELGLTHEDATTLVHDAAADLRTEMYAARAYRREADLTACNVSPKAAETWGFQFLGYSREGMSQKVRKATEQAEKSRYSGRIHAVK